jgi:imidazoleglycerol-phosphate dehydratase/histidinol-phosphatase
MRKIACNLDYELVMVTNQDGMGTFSFPEESFWPVQKFVIKSFENEGVQFRNIFIDRSLIADNNPSRKPGIGMLMNFLNNPAYEIKRSFVIGDRITDMQLAKNLGCKGIWLKNDDQLGITEIKDPSSLKKTIALETPDWKRVYRFLKTM